MHVKLLTEQHLEFLSLKGGCTGSSESTLVKIPHCWKSSVLAQNFMFSWRKLAIWIPCLMGTVMAQKRRDPDLITHNVHHQQEAKSSIFCHLLIIFAKGLGLDQGNNSTRIWLTLTCKISFSQKLPLKFT